VVWGAASIFASNAGTAAECTAIISKGDQ